MQKDNIIKQCESMEKLISKIKQNTLEENLDVKLIALIEELYSKANNLYNYGANNLDL